MFMKGPLSIPKMIFSGQSRVRSRVLAWMNICAFLSIWNIYIYIYRLVYKEKLIVHRVHPSSNTFSSTLMSGCYPGPLHYQCVFECDRDDFLEVGWLTHREWNVNVEQKESKNRNSDFHRILLAANANANSRMKLWVPENALHQLNSRIHRRGC